MLDIPIEILELKQKLVKQIDHIQWIMDTSYHLTVFCFSREKENDLYKYLLI